MGPTAEPAGPARGAPRPSRGADRGPRRPGGGRPGKGTKPPKDQGDGATYELHMRLENCHGIGSLDYTFCFPDEKPHMAIYASNGTMKSSLAKTLEAVAKDDPDNRPRDDIYPERKVVCDILGKNGEKIDPGSILVIKSYESVPNTDDMATGILVNPRLRDRYRAAVAGIAGAEKELLARLSDKSGVKRGEVEGKLLADLGAAGTPRKTLYGMLEDALEGADPPAELTGIRYQTLFNSQTDEVWRDPNFVKSLSTYIEKYDMLLEDSPYLSKKFNHTGANSAKKALDDTGFFRAEHVVGMRPEGGGKHILKDSGGLGDAIREDLERIEKGLRDEWDRMDKALVRNRDRRGLREYLSDNRDLIPRLVDIGGLKRDLWRSYIAQEVAAARRVVDAHRAGEKEIGEIVEAAGKERGSWEEIIERFHERFDVPFRMHVDNKPNAVIELEEPRLAFTHHEKPGGPGMHVERDQLDGALSMGEKKAFFTLSALFAIQERIDQGRQTLVVLDDIVDSFDYRNKYAVVEYLKDLSDSGMLHLLILTHNFDFFRTIQSRGVVRYDACRFVERGEDRTIEIKSATPLNNPLAEIMDRLGDRAKIAAAIPFARNIVEYTRGKKHADYAALSDMLHWRAGTTDKITIAELDRILRATFGRCIKEDDCPHDCTVWKVVDGEADRIASSGGEADLYGKVALSIATRMRAERFATAELARRGKAPPGEHPRTHRLIADYKEHCAPGAGGGNGDNGAFGSASRTLDRVSLMTPEVIHLNSFMYEPILDMSGRHLSKLYREVKKLDEGADDGQ